MCELWNTNRTFCAFTVRLSRSVTSISTGGSAMVSLACSRSASSAGLSSFRRRVDRRVFVTL
ncbi:hypothetical protein D3C78_1808440 [compost metagenome]